jgi:hypothetical protein
LKDLGIPVLEKGSQRWQHGSNVLLENVSRGNRQQHERGRIGCLALHRDLEEIQEGEDRLQAPCSQHLQRLVLRDPFDDGHGELRHVDVLDVEEAGAEDGQTSSRGDDPRRGRKDVDHIKEATATK